MFTAATSSSAVAIISTSEAPMTTSAIVAESVSGSHVLQIKGYSLTKGLGNGKFIKSEPFDIGGHRWHIWYYPDGDESESADWISLYLRHDPTDDVDVKAVFKFSVLDHIGESVPLFSQQSSCRRTFSRNDRSWGFRKFVARKDLEESSYLKDDCFKVRCDITISKDIISTEATLQTQCVVVPPSNMNQHFGSLLSGTVGADVTFDVAGEMFAAHRCVLAARSSVFMAELFGPMKEKAMNCIRIEDMEAAVIKDMLHFIYTDTMPEIEDKEDVLVITQHLLVAADRYDLERLKLICEDKLCKSIDTSTVATMLALAERQGCHGLKKACFELLKSPSHLKTVMETEGFDHLMTTCPCIIKELLAKVVTNP